MIKQTKTIISVLVTAVMLSAIAVPAQAGTLTIFNDNCTKTYNFSTKKRVKVHVYSTLNNNCTAKEVTVRQGESRTLDLIAGYRKNGESKQCFYFHEANGTVGGKQDVNGKRDSHVTCKKDWIGTCQCKLDSPT